jgi:Rrf2 family nitric oxide-sensitive transcriptional repressor
MRLTRYTDYAIRVLMYLAAQPDQFCAISKISADYGISHNHLTKVVHDLGRLGFVQSLRGRNGGIQLARPASDITVGEVVRTMEDDFTMADCANCVIAPGCGLNPVLEEATTAFLAVIDRYTLAELCRSGTGFMTLFPAFNATRPTTKS